MNKMYARNMTINLVLTRRGLEKKHYINHNKIKTMEMASFNTSNFS